MGIIFKYAALYSFLMFIMSLFIYVDENKIKAIHTGEIISFLIPLTGAKIGFIFLPLLEETLLHTL